MAVVSNDFGIFSIADIPVGNYSVIASKPDFISSNISISVTENNTVQADFVISKDLGVNNDPSIPRYTTPVDRTNNNPVSLTLEWSCSDPDGDALNYDIYFWEEGDNSSQMLFNFPLNTFTIPITLKNSTTYFWMVIANDSVGGIGISPIWSFKTTP